MPNNSFINIVEINIHINSIINLPAHSLLLPSHLCMMECYHQMPLSGWSPAHLPSVVLPHIRWIGRAVFIYVILFTYTMKYKVFEKSPMNQITIINTLNPSTLLLVWLETSCGIPSIAYIDNETIPMALPYISTFKYINKPVIRKTNRLKIPIIITQLTNTYKMAWGCSISICPPYQSVISFCTLV